jgi:hypothetical protein
MIHTRCLAVLETMWGGNGHAPGLFRINPNNFTGRRLYWLLGHEDLWVTNACRELVANARLHGEPDPAWLAKNLQRLTYDLLLVCGKVAQTTYGECGYMPDCRVLEMPHPASRSDWSRLNLEAWQKLIQSGAH